MESNDKLEQESDRSAFLIVGALLETNLEKLILAKLKEGTSLRHIGANNFAAKIDLSFALGLIEDGRKNLYHSFRKIRNNFAHSAEFLSFENVDIKAMFESDPKLGKAFDDAIENVLSKQEGMPDSFSFEQFWTPRKKFNILFQAEVAHLQSVIEQVNRIE